MGFLLGSFARLPLSCEQYSKDKGQTQKQDTSNHTSNDGTDVSVSLMSLRGRLAAPCRRRSAIVAAVYLEEVKPDSALAIFIAGVHVLHGDFESTTERSLVS